MQQRLPRRAIRVPVIYKRLDLEEPALVMDIGQTEDLSEGGACLKLQSQLPVSCRVGLVLFTTPRAVDVEARVIWTRGRDKSFHHGVEFLQMGPTHFTSLLEALAQEKSLRQQALRLPIRMPVLCRVVGASGPSLEGWTRDLSRTGVLLRLPRQLPTNAEVEITLKTRREEQFRGRVRWVGTAREGSQPIRHGIEFLQAPLAPERFMRLFFGAPDERGRGEVAP
ncbi:MAG: PilZ domain-containing protein [Candidatus Methylomirabilales bacterium]